MSPHDQIKNIWRFAASKGPRFGQQRQPASCQPQVRPQARCQVSKLSQEIAISARSCCGSEARGPACYRKADT